MSFLNQLKTQAQALQTSQSGPQANVQSNTAQTELACKTIALYINDLAQQLNVIAPAGPRLSVDGKTPWPAMKLLEFRYDARKKMLRNTEVVDYIAMGWRILPAIGKPVGGAVEVNFPPELERVQSRLAAGNVQHERKEIRHPEKNTLLALRFEYLTEARGSLVVTPAHDNAQIAFRIGNANGFEVVNTSYPASAIRSELLDELAKYIVVQPSRFV
jgi:hypothetical protein